MSTYTDIRYDYNLPSGYGGSLQLISEQTASASSSISFTTGIDSTYRTYLFKFINMHPQTIDAKFEFNLSTDGGSNYNVTKTSTAFYAYHNETGSVSALEYYAPADLAQSTSYQHLSVDMMNDADSNSSGEIYLFSPSSTTFVKHFIAKSSTNTNAIYITNSFVAGYGNTTSAVNAINFKMSSGNIDAGTILMYGIE